MMCGNTKSRVGRLTASSMALAAILTMGAPAGWAQEGNVTVEDGGSGATLPVGSEDHGTLIVTPMAPDKPVALDMNNNDAEALHLVHVDDDEPKHVRMTVGTDGIKNLPVLTLAKDADTAKLKGQGTVEFTGHGGHLVKNASSGEVGHLHLTEENLHVTIGGAGGILGDVIGKEKAPNIVTITGHPDNGARFTARDVKHVTLRLDPVVAGVNTIESSDIGIGKNSMLLIGGQVDTTPWATKMLADLGITGTNHNDWSKSEYTAILAIAAPTTIGTDNGYVIDGSKTNADGDYGITKNKVTLAANSMLAIDAARLVAENAAALKFSTAGTVTVTGTTGLYIANASADMGTIKLIENATLSGTFNPEKVMTDSRLTAGNVVTAGSNTTVAVGYAGAAAGYAAGNMTQGMARAIDGVYNGLNNVKSTDAGVKFISRATNIEYLDTGKNDREVVTTLEGAAALASTVGVQTGSYSISNAVTGRYNARLSYLRDTAPAAGNTPGEAGVWINPFYNFSDVDGVSIGNHKTAYEISYGGATIGVDTNVSEAARLGLAFSVGGGDTESTGSLFNKTDSKFDFWGVGVYGSYTNGRFGLTGDLGYTGTSYEIDQTLPAAMAMSPLDADVDTKAITAGVTGEYRFAPSGGTLNLIPHLGLRYTSLDTDSYKIRERGATVFDVASEKQNIFTIPVGLTFTGDIATEGGWVVKPKADFGVIFAAGDLDAESEFRVGATGVRGGLTASDVVDSVTFNSVIGIQADAGNGLSIGLDYNLQASGNQTNHGLTGMLRYTF